MVQKSKGQFFVDRKGKVHIETEGGKVVRGVHYPDARNQPMQLMFKVSIDKKFLVAMLKGLPWTAARIRKDGWVTRLFDSNTVVPKRDKGRFGYIL